MRKQLVRIDWHCDEFHWNWFYVIGATPRGLRLKGANDPDTGFQHDGTCVDAGWDEIWAIWPASDEVDQSA